MHVLESEWALLLTLVLLCGVRPLACHYSDSENDGGQSRFKPSRPFLRIGAFIILGAMGLAIVSVLLAAVASFAPRVFQSTFFQKYNFFVCFAVVFGLLQFALHPKARANLSWKKLSAIWLKSPAVSSVTLGGFGLLSTSEKFTTKFTQSVMSSPYTNANLLVAATLLGVALMGVALLVSRVGQTYSSDEDTTQPPLWFYAAFLPAFASNVILFSLLLNCILLTAHAHVLQAE